MFALVSLEMRKQCHYHQSTHLKVFLFSLEIAEQTRQTRDWKRNKIAVIHDNMIICIKSSNRADKQLEIINSVWLLNTESTYENQWFSTNINPE